MDDDFGGVIALLLLPILLVIALIYLAVYLVAIVAVLAVPVGIGIGTNLLIRFCANDADLQEADERRIWRWIIGIACVPFLAGGLAALLVSGGIRAGDSSMVLVLPGYLLWLAGYLWACFDSRFEQGKS